MMAAKEVQGVRPLEGAIGMEMSKAPRLGLGMIAKVVMNPRTNVLLATILETAHLYLETSGESDQ